MLFYDALTQRETQIASGLPAPLWPRGAYHIDPHPRFSPRGRFVVYTTTVADGVTLALCPVAELAERTS